MITVLHISLNICSETKFKAIRLVRVGSDLIWHPSFDRDYEVHIELIWDMIQTDKISYYLPRKIFSLGTQPFEYSTVEYSVWTFAVTFGPVCLLLKRYGPVCLL